MINNYMCDECSHYFVCDKLPSLMKFHEDAKKDLKVIITMDDCLDFAKSVDEYEDRE